LSVVRRIRAGQIDVNGDRFSPLARFGGYKRSGIGREFGPYGPEDSMQVKAIAR
jgi:aldehyde dehydrogenase (NAD+)